MCRGVIQHPERACQVIDFSGIRYANMTPTNIDGLLEYGNKAVILYEYKMGGVEMPKGQELALTRAVTNLTHDDKSAILLLCRHNCPPEESIDGAGSIVDRIFYKGRWRSGKGLTAKEVTDKFLQKLGLIA